MTTLSTLVKVYICVLGFCRWEVFAALVGCIVFCSLNCDEVIVLLSLFFCFFCCNR